MMYRIVRARRADFYTGSTQNSMARNSLDPQILKDTMGAHAIRPQKCVISKTLSEMLVWKSISTLLNVISMPFPLSTYDMVVCWSVQMSVSRVNRLLILYFILITLH